MVEMDEFVKVMTNQQPSICRRLNQATTAAVNRQKLNSKTVLLCKRQNILLRGHRDSILDVELSPNTQLLGTSTVPCSSR